MNVLKQVLQRTVRKRPAPPALNADPIHKALQDITSRGGPALCNLGCGVRHHQDWLNIDFQGDGRAVFSWDLRQGVPLPGGSCDAVYASHVIEHFTCPQADRFLAECKRLLKPGGILRLVTPDLENVVKTYLHCLAAARQGEPGATGRYRWIILELLDQLTRHQSGGEMLKLWSLPEVPAEDFVAQRVGVEYWRARKHLKGRTLESAPADNPLEVGSFRLGGEPHLWMYDSYSLRNTLSVAGFESIQERSASESGIEGFAIYNLDTEPDGAAYKPDSFYMEAVKP